MFIIGQTPWGSNSAQDHMVLRCDFIVFLKNYQLYFRLKQHYLFKLHICDQKFKSFIFFYPKKTTNHYRCLYIFRLPIPIGSWSSFPSRVTHLTVAVEINKGIVMLHHISSYSQTDSFTACAIIRLCRSRIIDMFFLIVPFMKGWDWIMIVLLLDR